MSDGKGCKCGAWNQGECACDADWTPQIVYDQQSRIDQLEALIRDVAIPELEDDGARRHCPEREEALTKLRDGLCLGDMTMKCEHCGQPAMRGWIIFKRCWQIFGGDE